jgi:hypothetical protein
MGSMKLLETFLKRTLVIEKVLLLPYEPAHVIEKGLTVGPEFSDLGLDKVETRPTFSLLSLHWLGKLDPGDHDSRTVLDSQIAEPELGAVPMALSTGAARFLALTHRLGRFGAQAALRESRHRC